MRLSVLARRRRAAALVEFALISPILLSLLLGIWEIGRVVDCMQVLDNAAREAARKAAVDSIVDPVSGQTVNIYATDVTNAAKYYLARQGYNTTNVQVTFQDLTNTGVTDPYQASRLDHLRITVTIPYADVSWGVATPFMSPTAVLTATVDWYNLSNDAFSVNEIIPGAN